MNILIAPLNWGLGHATRCIPLIRKFQKEGHRERASLAQQTNSAGAS